MIPGGGTTIEPENARTLLQAAQQQRSTWITIGVQLMGYTVVLNVGIWSLFLKAYLDSLASPRGVQPLYIGAASAISAIVLSLWRLYDRSIDHRLAMTYPDFILYEHCLGAPVNVGVTGLLTKASPNLARIFLDNDLPFEQKLRGVSLLVVSRRSSRFGKLVFDICILAIILATGTASAIMLRAQFQSMATILCVLGSAIGLGIELFAFFHFEREASETDVDKMIADLKKADQTEAA